VAWKSSDSSASSAAPTVGAYASQTSAASPVACMPSSARKRCVAGRITMSNSRMEPMKMRPLSARHLSALRPSFSSCTKNTSVLWKDSASRTPAQNEPKWLAISLFHRPRVKKLAQRM